MKAWMIVCLLVIASNAAAAQKTPRGRNHPNRTVRVRRDPLSIRMLNPCALSYGYKSTDPKDPTAAFWASVLAGIPAALGDKDSRGNMVMKFSRWSDGIEACRRFQLGPHYGSLIVERAIKKWDGGPTWKGYAAYVHRRTGLNMQTKLRELAVPAHRKLIQAQSEWEAGRVQRGIMGDAELSTPPPPRNR